jgi:uncharacterized protein (DUF362 family)
MKHYRVSIAKNRNPERATREALKLLGGMDRIVSKNDTVLIKPNNLISKYVPGTVTSKEVVAALAVLVKEAGGRPVIGENNLAYDASSANAKDSCGKHYYDELAKVGLEKEVPLVDLEKDKKRSVKIPGARVLKATKIAETVFKVDKLIDVAVMKTHDQTQATLGIKNLKGVIPQAEKMRSHALGVQQAIVDLCAFIKPALVVIDGTTAAEGMGPTGGTPIKMNLVIAAENALAADMVGVSVMGFEVERIRFLRYAVDAGLGPKGLDEIEVLGRPIASVRRKFVTAESVVRKQYKEMGIEVISKDACSGCWAEFRHIYYSLGDDRSKLKGTTFVLGRTKTLPLLEKAVILGKCAKAVSGCGLYVAGCPPHHDRIEHAARKIAGIKRKRTR